MSKLQLNTVREEAMRLLEDDYYRFTNLSKVLGISEEEAKILKGYIMKEFWYGNLENSLISFHGVTEAKISVKGGLENKVFITREVFRSLLLPNHLNASDKNKININKRLELEDLDKKCYSHLLKQKWEFYEELIKKTAGTTNPEDTSKSLYLPNLAIHIKDLRFVLNKYSWKEIIERLPPLPRSAKKYKVSTEDRDKWIIEKYKEKVSVLRSSSNIRKENISTIAKEINAEIRTDKVMKDANSITDDSVRRIIHHFIEMSD